MNMKRRKVLEKSCIKVKGVYKLLSGCVCSAVFIDEDLGDETKIQEIGNLSGKNIY